ncbi:MAG: amidohydrolase, partial [Planctomycetaceae bacterium]
MNMDKEIRKLMPHLCSIRHYIHQNPETAYEEVGTAAIVERELRACNIEVKRIGKTGVVGLLRGKRGGKTVGLRADMDALPIVEQTGLPYASTNGKMHACGHDGHTTTLIGVAHLLAGMRDTFTGNVKFIFQPAEEGDAGGEMMCQAGVMKNPKVDAIFALHDFPDSPVGTIRVSPGPTMAATDGMHITVTGRGGHGARPNFSVDPIVIAARIIEGLQTIVSRELSPTSSAVISVCTINSGSAKNIIPDTVEMSGTVRTLDEKVRLQMREAITRLATGTAASHRGKAKVTFDGGYPVLVNEPGMTAFLREVAGKVIGVRNVLDQEVSMGGEDFSYYL